MIASSSPPLVELFILGGPIMWPILITGIIALTVVFERIFFLIADRVKTDPKLVAQTLRHIEQGDFDDAAKIASSSRDPAARCVAYALNHREESLSAAFLHASGQELRPYQRGLSVLDTIITLAPLLGLLGTVTGMISAFNLVGGAELGAPAAITGGIAEALIATAAGLGVAIVSLIPFNILNTRLENARHRIEDIATHVEILLQRPKTS